MIVFVLFGCAEVAKRIYEKHLLDFIRLANPSTWLVLLTVHRWAIIYLTLTAGLKYKQGVKHLTDLYKYIGHFPAEVSYLSLCLNQ